MRTDHLLGERTIVRARLLDRDTFRTTIRWGQMIYDLFRKTDAVPLAPSAYTVNRSNSNVETLEPPLHLVQQELIPCVIVLV